MKRIQITTEFTKEQKAFLDFIAEESYERWIQSMEENAYSNKKENM